MDSKVTKEVVSHLQIISREVYVTVLQSLTIGMSEFDIAEMIRLEYAKKGISEYWYEAPRNVLIGAERFKIGTTTSDYDLKNPKSDIVLEEDQPLYIDLAPIDADTKVWGDWSRTIIFHPKEEDEEQVQFLQEFQQIHRDGIDQITAQTTGSEVANYYLHVFKEKGITLLDVRNNVGHSIHAVPKAQAKRIWLDGENNLPLGEGIYTVEPGGSRERKDGKGFIVARFEECISIPKTGNAVILGDPNPLPFFIK